MIADCGLLVNVNRGIIYAGNGTDFADRAGQRRGSSRRNGQLPEFPCNFFSLPFYFGFPGLKLPVGAVYQGFTSYISRPRPDRRISLQNLTTSSRVGQSKMKMPTNLRRLQKDRQL